MSEVTVIQQKPKLVTRLAERFGIDPGKMMATLKATAFRGDVTDEQMMALLVVAEQYELNPWTKEIYAFPDKGGIIPVVGVDGWSRIINSHPAFDGMDFEQDDDGCTCTIYRKDRSHPIRVTEYMGECVRPTQPWKTHPRRMLRHKAMIQCARLAFGFVGIYDPDEAERIREIDITPQPDRLGIIDNPAQLFDPVERDEMIEKIDQCFSFDAATKRLECLDDEKLDECLDYLRSKQELKLAIWEHLPSKVRTYINAIEKS
jgi:hypothetical protein